MTYKEKRNVTKNIQCFSLIRLVKDVLYEGHDKPFFSFYDGDYFCGYDDNGNIKLSHEINDAQIGDNAFDTFIMAMDENKDWRKWSEGMNIKMWVHINDLLPKGGGK